MRVPFHHLAEVQEMGQAWVQKMSLVRARVPEVPAKEMAAQSVFPVEYQPDS